MPKALRPLAALTTPPGVTAGFCADAGSDASTANNSADCNRDFWFVTRAEQCKPVAESLCNAQMGEHATPIGAGGKCGA